MKNYFFILSFSRSGSTTLGQKLNNHSDVDVVNESWVFSLLGVLKWKKLTPIRQKYIFSQFNKEKNSSNIISQKSVKSISISPKDFFQSLTNSKANFLGEKTPANLFYYSYLQKQFQGAKFIFLKRHPLAICSSYYKRWYSSTYNDEFIIETVDVIKAYNEKFEAIKDKDKILQLKYEDLVSESKKWLTKIAKHIGFEFEDSMLAESKQKLFEDSKVEEHHKESHESLNDFHIDKYKNVFTPKQIQELSFLLRNEIKNLGYPYDKDIRPDNRLINLDKKINNKRTSLRIYLTANLKLLKAKLSYLKFILKLVIR